MKSQFRSFVLLLKVAPFVNLLEQKENTNKLYLLTCNFQNERENMKNEKLTNESFVNR